MQSLDQIFLQQRNLSEYCRTGEYKPLANITEARVQHYRRLVFNNIEDSLSTAYPLAKSLLGEDMWDRLAYDFFSKVNCTAPQIWKMPFELLSYVENHEPKLIAEFPQLMDLLKFEWMEIELFMMPDRINDWPSNRTGNLVDDILLLNPEHQIERLRFPVHIKISGDISANDEGNYFVLGYREPQSGDVNFVDLSPIYVWLIESFKGTETTLHELCHEASCVFGIEKEILLANTQPFFMSLMKRKFLTIKK